MNRRQFLRTSAATSLLAGSSNTLHALAADNAYRKNIGIQLYTLRNQIKADTAGTIKTVVDAGYKQGEMYGFPNCDPMIAAAKDAGLGLHSSHFEWDTVVNPKDDGMSDFKKIIEKANKVGLSHLVIPYLHGKDRKDLDGYKRVAEQCNKAAVLTKAAGLQLAYHNHAFEFKPMGGPTGFDIFVKEFDKDMQFRARRVLGKGRRCRSRRSHQVAFRQGFSAAPEGSAERPETTDLRRHAEGGLQGTGQWHDSDGTNHRGRKGCWRFPLPRRTRPIARPDRLD